MIKESSAYEAEYSEGLLVVKIRGEVDHHSAGGMRKGIDAEIAKQRPEKLIIDLSEVNFMDSAGLGLIIGRYSAVRQVGGEMVVVNPSKGVMKILKLAGTERIIKIEQLDIGNEKKAKEKKAKEKKASAEPKGRRR